MQKGVAGLLALLSGISVCILAHPHPKAAEHHRRRRGRRRKELGDAEGGHEMLCPGTDMVTALGNSLQL